jgi:hypothetical protein
VTKYPTDDPNGIFPANDGITPFVANNVPPGFDLRNILSESMRARPVWNDCATAASRVVYEYVEKTRLALNASREPEVLSRVLKIATLRMLGIDWGSDLLLDEDYDRMLESVAAYLQQHGPSNFVHYMGYSLGVPMDMIPLWTKDYAEFGAGVPVGKKSIFDGPLGEYYPTSHVDVAYEEFAPRAPPLANAIKELTDTFYKLAPIHLVLNWIATQITLSVGTLYFYNNSYEKSEDFADADYPNKVYLYLSLQNYDKETVQVNLQPPHPARTVPLSYVLYSDERGYDTTRAGFTGAWFQAGYNLFNSGLTVVSPGGYLPCVKADASALRASIQPDPSYRAPDGTTGLVVVPARYCRVYNPTNPTVLQGRDCLVAAGPNLPDSEKGFTVTTKFAGAFVYTLSVGSGTDCVSLGYHPHSNQVVRISRGTQWVQASISGGVVTVSAETSVGTQYGCYLMGAGYYVLWAVLTGDVVKVCPGYDVVGSIDWLYLQAEYGSTPSPHGPSTHLPVPVLRAGVNLNVESYLFNRPYGTFVMQAYGQFVDSVGTFVLFHTQSSSGDYIKITLEQGYYYAYLSLGNSKQALTIGSYSTGHVALYFGWTPTSITFKMPGYSQTVSVKMPSNFVSNNFFAYVGNPVAELWVLKTLAVLGALDTDSLPDDSLINTLLS